MIPSSDEGATPYDTSLPFIETALSPFASSATPSNQPSLATQFVPQTPPETSLVAPERPISHQGKPYRLRGRVILLCCLFLLLLVEVGGFAYYAGIVEPQQLRVQAATVTRNFLRTHQSLTIAQMKAMTPEQLYTSITNTTPMIADALTGPEGNLWYDYGDNKNGCSFSQGAYHLHLSVAASYDCLSYGSLYTDFALQVNMTILNADEAGLSFHLSNNGGYYFVIGPQGAYALYLSQNASGQQGQIKVLYRGQSTAILTGFNQSNQLTVIAVDSTFYLYVNGLALTHVADTTYFNGQIALSGGNSANSTDIAFKDVKIWGLA